VKIVASTLTLLVAVSAIASAAVQLSQAEALIRAETAAKKSGYELKKYRLNGGNGVLKPGARYGFSILYARNHSA